MISRPSNPAPYNTVVSPPSTATPIHFKASCGGNGAVSGVRLMINDNSNRYYFPFNSTAVVQREMDLAG